MLKGGVGWGSCSGNRESSVSMLSLSLSRLFFDQSASESVCVGCQLHLWEKPRWNELKCFTVCERDRHAPPVKNWLQLIPISFKGSICQFVPHVETYILSAAGSLMVITEAKREHEKITRGKRSKLNARALTSEICAFNCHLALHLWHHAEHVTMVTSFYLQFNVAGWRAASQWPPPYQQHAVGIIGILHIGWRHKSGCCFFWRGGGVFYRFTYINFFLAPFSP